MQSYSFINPDTRKQEIIYLRKPTEDDLNIMFQILKDTLSKFLSINVECDEYNQLSIKKEDVRDYIINPIFVSFVATHNEQIVGWCSGSNDDSIIEFHGLENFDKPFYLRELVVHSKHQQRGIGKFLFNKIINTIHSYSNTLVLDTPMQNESSIIFYKNMGCIPFDNKLIASNSHWCRLYKIVAKT